MKALALTMDKIDKTYGKGTLMRLGDKQVIHAETIPTGSLGLDIALGYQWFSKRKDRRNLWTRIIRKNITRHPCDR